jgi:hypothetical protein
MLRLRKAHFTCGIFSRKSCRRPGPFHWLLTRRLRRFAFLPMGIMSPSWLRKATLVSRIVVGDLRKQTILAGLNKGDQEDRIINIASMSFDPSGKYLLYGGENGSAVVTSKDWTKPAARLNDPAKVSAVSWGKGFEPSLAGSNSIIVCSHGHRKVTICDMTAPSES